MTPRVAASQSRGIVVVGAGLVGPVAAMYLARRHGPVTVLEQRPDPRGTSTRADRSLTVILSARGWRVMKDLGLAERVRGLCLPLKGRMGHLPDGSTDFTPYSRDGSPIWAVERRRLQLLLLDAAAATPGVELRFGQRVHAIDLDGPGVTVGDGSGTHRLSCTRLLGCDGARSAVRAAMVRRGARERVGTLELAYQEINLPLPGCDPEIMHYWPAGDALFGVFPMLSADLFAGSVFLRREGPAPSFAAASSPEDRARQFHDLFPKLTAHIPDLRDQLAAKPVSTVSLVRCDTWVHGESTALLGDACHAMAPFMGQGMNCGFEDARTLVRLLDETGDWGAALARYQDVRRADGDSIADISHEHYRTMSRLPGQSETELESAVIRRLQDLFPGRFVPLYERCAFSEQSYASAWDDEQALRRVAHALTRSHGTAVRDLTDDQLRRHRLLV
jgi:kynurenine 3-monooxygenase